ncbi:DUF2085 domain-containing protein [candidate division FCPU426 bacterium]|nr:DUF2085 domain-containing protein [candidate division FCPU426 bacterium]
MPEIFAMLAWAFCARQPAHVLDLHGVSFPFCVRCMAWYGGLGITFLFLWASGRNRSTALPTPGVIGWSLGWLLAMGADGVLDMLGLCRATFFSRLLTGWMAGTGIPLLLVPGVSKPKPRGAQQPVLRSGAAVGLWGIAGLHLAGCLYIPALGPTTALLSAYYCTLLAMIGCIGLLYTVSRLAISQSPLRGAWWRSPAGAWVLAGGMYVLLWSGHTIAVRLFLFFP